MQLARIGGANWDLYVNANGGFYAIAKPGSGASDSHFGDKAHVVRLMRDYPCQDHFSGWTEAGREALSGIYSRWVAPTKVTA